ncbi:MAG: DUF4340 domain-containing protein [Lentisphaerae bacterium]|nr:DUF4340 domain-containing protein [Lentisphaerota bacterium]
MTSKKLAMLAGAAVVLVGLAFLSGQRNAVKTPAAHGKKLFPQLDVSQVATIEITKPSGDTLTLTSSDAGWTVSALHGYPADLVKIRENVLKLAELKAGQEAPGRSMANPTTIRLKDAAGKTLAELALGDQYMRKSDDMGFGSYPDGRYVTVEGRNAVYLVDDTLTSLDGDVTDWVDMQIPSPSGSTIRAVEISNAGEEIALVKTNGTWKLVDLGPDEAMETSKTYSLDTALSYLRFNGIADPALTDDALGLSTGAVYRAVYADGITYTARISGSTTNSSDRAFRIAASFTPTGTNVAENVSAEAKVNEFNAKTSRWTYLIASYNADKFMLTRSSLAKPKSKDEDANVNDDGATTDETPEETSVAAPDEATTEAPEAASDEKPAETTTEVPEATADADPAEATTEAPEAASDEKPAEAVGEAK